MEVFNVNYKKQVRTDQITREMYMFDLINVNVAMTPVKVLIHSTDVASTIPSQYGYIFIKTKLSSGTTKEFSFDDINALFHNAYSNFNVETLFLVLLLSPLKGCKNFSMPCASSCKKAYLNNGE